MATQRKEPEPAFYRSLHYPDELQPGVRIKLSRSVEFVSYEVDRSNLTELVTLPLKELQSRHKDRAAEEKAVFEKVQSAAEKWVTKAAQTMLLDRALEYVQTPEVKHTSNEWKEQENGIWEISNRVYKMRYTVQKETKGPKKGRWLAMWGIAINRPDRPPTEKYYYTGDIMVVEQKKKYYNAETDARQYIQGRFNVYAHLFTELSPPVPEQFKRHFHINGVLLPGYTIAPPERAPQEVADELLSLLEDDDIAPPPSVEPGASKDTEETSKTAAEKPPVPRPARPAPKQKVARKKRSAPAR